MPKFYQNRGETAKTYNRETDSSEWLIYHLWLRANTTRNDKVGKLYSFNSNEICIHHRVKKKQYNYYYHISIRHANKCYASAIQLWISWKSSTLLWQDEAKIHMIDVSKALFIVLSHFIYFLGRMFTHFYAFL